MSIVNDLFYSAIFNICTDSEVLNSSNVMRKSKKEKVTSEIKFLVINTLRYLKFSWKRKTRKKQASKFESQRRKSGEGVFRWRCTLFSEGSPPLLVLSAEVQCI
jgi:hypothetical protein